MNVDNTTLLEKARNCLRLEIAAIQSTSDHLDENFPAIIQAIANTLLAKKKIIFTGVGKNVHICQKLVGTFNSTGAPACFLDPMQALHGDLGLCAKDDLAFLMSNSGQTSELISLLPLIKRLEVKTVAITANVKSELATNSDYTLTYKVHQEACPLNLAPTASTTAALALGDALAMVYLEIRGFSREDFAKYHPGGNLGKALLMRVDEIMRSGDNFACLPEGSTVQEAIIAITRAKCGTIALTDPKTGKISGVFSDGDLRRCSLNNTDFLQHRICEYMTRDPKTIHLKALAVDVLKIFEKTQINALIVENDQGKPVGLIDGQDIPKLKIV
jgi:arabinose-5-phosphate isomerase